MTDQPNSEEAIFHEALQLPPEKRVDYLGQVCGSDDSLRRRIEVLLQAGAEADPFFDQGPLHAAMGEKAQNPAPEVLSASEKPGALIGRYKLLQKIGEGGMGAVYMAEQEEPVRRRVALKIIKLGMDTKQVVARFEAERQALALMDHPNIARVLDGGATETGRPYFVMELVQGVPITEFCDKNQLSTEKRLKLFIPVCEAIQSAHQKGIIHRDLKPTNILVTLNPDGTGAPKVIDFGVAKATNQKLTEKTLFTAHGMMVGTPAYMSPEQAEMSNLDVDTRSDIYSLGALLYELLTGSPPFPEQRLRSAGYNEMQRIILHEQPERPSTRAASRTFVSGQSEIKSQKSKIGNDLDWIVMKCLEKDRARRYETANGLAHDIARHLNNETVTARPPSRLYEFQKTVRRHWVGFTAVVAVLAALAIGMAISLLEAVRARRAENLAMERMEESATIAKFLGDVFQSPDPNRNGRTVTVAESLSSAEKRLETDLARQPEIRGKLQAAIAQSYHNLGLNFEAIPLQEKVRDYYVNTHGLEYSNSVSALHQLALYYDEVGRAEESLKLTEQVLALRRKLNGPEHPDTLQAMGALERSYWRLGRAREALPLVETELGIRRRLNGPEDPGTIGALEHVANIYEALGQNEEALKLREQALPLRQKVNGPEHPDTLWAMGNLANSYYYLGQADKALKLREQVLPLRQKLSGPEHPDTLIAMINLSASYEQVGRVEEALKLREQLVPLRLKVSGLEHSETLWAMNDLANSYYVAGRREDALKLHQQVLQVRRKRFGPENPDTLSSLNSVAWIQATCPLPELRNGTNAVNLMETAVAATHRTNAPFLDTLAAAYAEAQQFDKAVAVQQERMPLLHTDEEKADSASRLKLYQSNKPYRTQANPP